MGVFFDLVKDLPVTGVLRERLALAEQKYQAQSDEIERLKAEIADLRRENAELRKRLPVKPDSLSPDTIQLLVHLFKTPSPSDCTAEAIARHLRLAHNVLMYHLDRLQEAGLAHVSGIGYFDECHWAVTTEGRKYVIDNGLL